MAKFKIEVQEVSQKIFEVEADTLTEALALVVDDYKNGKIEILPEDLKQALFRQYGDCQQWGAGEVIVC